MISNKVCKSEKIERNSSFELLRLLAICGVLLGHYNNAGNLRNVANGINKLLIFFSTSIFWGAVPVLILISAIFCVRHRREGLLKYLSLFFKLFYIELWVIL